jgi:hypothetical protein
MVLVGLTSSGGGDILRNGGLATGLATKRLRESLGRLWWSVSGWTATIAITLQDSYALNDVFGSRGQEGYKHNPVHKG